MTLGTLHAALEVYDDVRRPFSQGVQEGSDKNGMNYQLRRAGWENVSAEDSGAGRYPRELLDVLAKEFAGVTSWTRDSSILTEREGVVARIAALAA